MAERPNRRRQGSEAEAKAAVFLESRGHRVVARNFRAGRGEVDLITMDRGVLVFVEVKSASTDAFGEPEEKVDARKRRRIGNAALAFLSRSGTTDRDCRFDVVAVKHSVRGCEIRHIENAFWLER